MSNTAALFERLHAAALRTIAANGITSVGRDGRMFFRMESVDAEGALATLLVEMHGELPTHSETCSARRSKIALCDCGLPERILQIVADFPSSSSDSTTPDTKSRE